MNALAVVKSQSLEFTDQQRAMIRQTYAPDASPAEFAVLMEVAKARNLNPLTKQIWFVKLGGKWSFQVSIDGLRAVAQRSGLYAGQDPAVYQYDGKGAIVSCSVAVYRKDWQRPAVGTAFFKEFSTGQNLWASKPHVMIAKVAEAIALRKAFSEDMSGLYGEGELDAAQAAPQPFTPPRVVAAPPAPEPSDADDAVFGDAQEEPYPEAYDQTTGEVEEPAHDYALMTLPYGRAKGQTVMAAPLGDLKWVLGAVTTAIDDPAKEKYRDANLKLQAAIKWALGKRGEG